MRNTSENTVAKQTLSVIVKPQTYQRLHQEIGRGKISRFVEELIIRELDTSDSKLEREQKKFQQKLIADYKRESRLTPSKEDKMWEEAGAEDLTNE